MMKGIRILVLSLLTAMTFAAGANPDAKEAMPEPSSAIPARRDFPLNPQVNACEDFHAYVCSKAESAFKLRDDRSRHTFAFSDSDERILESKKEFMKNLPKEKKLSARGQQFKDFYLGCMDTKGRAAEEKKMVAQVTKELAKIKTAKEFVRYLNNQVFDGNDGLLHFYANPNLDNPKKLNASFGASMMNLPDHSYYAKDDVIEGYLKMLTQFFKTIDPKISDEEAGKRAQAQIDLQKDFIKTYPEAAIRRQRWSEKRTAPQADIAKKYPTLQLNKFMDKLPKSTLVNIPIPESLEFINAKLTDETLPTFKDYYLNKFVGPIMDEAYPEYFNARFEFNRKFFGGPEKRPDLQERCTSTTDDHFGLEIDQVLVDRLFPGFKDEKVHQVIEKIRASILDGLAKNTWLSPAAKAEATRKIKTARLQLVRPHNDREWDFMPVQKYSKKLYLGNMAIHGRAQLQKTFVDLRHPTNQDAWGMSPLTVNAYYSPNENKFVLPIGILQFPFYDKDGSLLENLGAVGAVAGHELGHSIDDEGSKYNADGKLSQWMETKDLAEFSKRGQKMIDQFNKIGHNGPLTQGENIADLVGLSFAYHAAFPGGNGAVEDKKKFFESYARVWCTVIRPQYAEVLLKRDPHAAALSRINEQVKHQPAFAEAYQCKSSDKMVLPEKDRVQIW